MGTLHSLKQSMVTGVILAMIFAGICEGPAAYAQEPVSETSAEETSALAAGTGRPGFASAVAYNIGQKKSITGNTWLKTVLPFTDVYTFSSRSKPGTDPGFFLYNEDGMELTEEDSRDYYDKHPERRDPAQSALDEYATLTLDAGVYYLYIAFTELEETPGKSCELNSACKNTNSIAQLEMNRPSVSTVDAWIETQLPEHICPGQEVSLSAGWAVSDDQTPTIKWEQVPMKYVMDDGTPYWDRDTGKARILLASGTTGVRVHAPDTPGIPITVAFTAVHTVGESYDFMDDYVEITTNGHTDSAWTRTVEPTLTTEGKEIQKCIYCNKVLASRNVPKLPAKPAAPEKNAATAASEEESAAAAPAAQGSLSLNVKAGSTVPLQVKKSTNNIKVTSLKKGDSVVSWKSDKPGIAKVTGRGKITGKKKGTAVITVTTAFGDSLSFKVKVQKKKVAVKQILITSPKKITLKKKGKAKIGASLLPVTTLEKISYKSSDRKVAVVKKGIITGKKKGSAVITVKAGNKSVRIRVRVK